MTYENNLFEAYMSVDQRIDYKEAKKWLLDNSIWFHSDYKLLCETTHIGYDFWFYSQEDAAAFKLKYGEYLLKDY